MALICGHSWGDAPGSQIFQNRISQSLSPATRRRSPPVPAGIRELIDGVSFRESATDSYTDWAIQKLFGGNHATMAADPDGDGQSNLMEFAFGSDPNNRRSAYTQDLRIADGQIHLCLTHPDHDTTGLSYDLEFSSDLKIWTRLRRIPGGPSLPEPPVTCLIPADAEGDRGFVRISVSLSAD